MGKSSGGGTTPDLVGAAREEGQQAKELAQQETFANRPTQYNPWGSTQWGTEQVWDPSTQQMVTQWTQTETLNPILQQQLDAQMGMNAAQQQFASDLFGQYSGAYTPLDFSQFGDVQQLGDVQGIDQFSYDPGQFRQQAEDAAYMSATSRLDPQFEQRQSQLENQLINQGLRPGDQAWNSAMDTFNRDRTDAYQQARYGATQQGLAESQNMFQQALGGFQAGLAGQQQGFTQQMQQNALANQLRQQQMEEAMLAQGYGLDEIQRIMQGIPQITGGTPSGSANQ